MRAFASSFGPLALALSLAAPLVGCDDSATPGDEDRFGGPPAITGEEDKADGEAGVEVMARLRPTKPVDGLLTAATPRVGYIVYAAQGTQLKLEVTRTGSSSGLDTVMKVYGPRRVDGSYPAAMAQSDDEGYGKLSLLKSVTAPADGFYLVEVAAKVAPTGDKKIRVALSCSGTCDSDQPVAPLGLDIRWTMRSAEYQALSAQAYGRASARIEAMGDNEELPHNWGVVLDIDETVLSNAQYQRERAELGVGYSGPSWLAWTKRAEATAIPGARAFLNTVRQRGGKIALVTNRKAAGECAPTEVNLRSEELPYDAILCRTDASDKNPRFAAVAAGTGTGLGPIEIVTFVGDNIQDFPELTQDIRYEELSAFNAFGERFFIIPNPMYGSWEKNAE